MEFCIRSATAMQELGRRLAACLEKGDVVILTGELGTGKTTLVKGIAAGLGVEEVVRSPSFVLVNEYAGRLRLYHADLYRVGPEVLADIDFAELAEEGVLVVEWGERVEAAWPPARLEVFLWHNEDGSRRVRFVPHGERWKEKLTKCLAR